MRENTPPRMGDISEEEDDVIVFDDEHLIGDDFEEISEEELLELVLSHSDQIRRNEEDEVIRYETPDVDDSILTFSKHNQPVYCCSLHPSRPWVVTGGHDDNAFVWNRNTGEIIKEITDHKDSVTAASFSSDGNYLATGDMSGEIQCFKIHGEDDFRKVWQYSMGDMSWMLWHRAANILFAATSVEGEIFVWRIPSGDCKVLPGHGKKCETAELTYDGKKLFAGYDDGTVKLWDIKSNSVIMEVNKDHHMGHTDDVTSVSCDNDNPVYVSGGIDGKLLFLSNNGPVDAINIGNLIEIVLFSPYSDLKVIATGTMEGDINIWDSSKHTLRATCENLNSAGITKMMWLKDYTLVVGTTLGNIFGFDARSGQRKFTLEGHQSEILDMQYDSEENILVTTSGDNTAKIFRCT